MSRVLIADDNENMALTCSNFLTKEKNIEVIGIVNNGIDAISSYEQNKPDILLLDLDMPKMNGIEVIEFLSKDEQERKKNNIIVISGTLDQLHPYNTTKLYRVMPKPLDYEKLIETINEAQGIIDSEILEEKIEDLLIDINLTDVSLKGLEYLKKAVFYCYNDENLLFNISQVYETIAHEYFYKKLKPKNILWSLESLIDAYQKSIDQRFLSSFFLHYDNSKNLTPKYLIELIVYQLKKAK